MIRERWHIRVLDLESLNEWKRICDEMNKLAASRGWTQSTFWTTTAGPWGEMVFEADYPDLATYENENAEWQADPEWQKLYSAFDQLRTDQNAYNELLETVELTG